MKTLFVTDLDGTLLRKNAMISRDSKEILQSLTKRGMYFSYATARALYTSAVATDGLCCSAPLITKNGVFINDPKSGEIIWENLFSNEETRDTYDDVMWLEIMPKHATKADAVLRLKEMCGCDYLVVFGDGINDIPMFQVADEGYAVENAVGELKEIATGVIAGNQKDGVAMWLQDYYGKYQ